MTKPLAVSVACIAILIVAYGAGVIVANRGQSPYRVAGDARSDIDALFAKFEHDEVHYYLRLPLMVGRDATVDIAVVDESFGGVTGFVESTLSAAYLGDAGTYKLKQYNDTMAWVVIDTVHARRLERVAKTATMPAPP